MGDLEYPLTDNSVTLNNVGVSLFKAHNLILRYRGASQREFQSILLRLLGPTLSLSLGHEDHLGGFDLLLHSPFGYP